MTEAQHGHAEEARMLRQRGVAKECTKGIIALMLGRQAGIRMLRG